MTLKLSLSNLIIETNPSNTPRASQSNTPRSSQSNTPPMSPRNKPLFRGSPKSSPTTPRGSSHSKGASHFSSSSRVETEAEKIFLNIPFLDPKEIKEKGLDNIRIKVIKSGIIPDAAKQGLKNWREQISKFLKEESNPFDANKDKEFYEQFLRMKNISDGAEYGQTWREQISKILKNERERIDYTNEDIDIACKEFNDKFHCSWAIMKQKGPEKKTLQIINDLRSLCIEEIFKKLRKEYSFTIQNLGSSNLTSDCDFSVAVNERNQSREAEIVKKFNEIFQIAWQASSAGVFDTNVYTRQYYSNVRDTEGEENRSSLHQEGSLLQAMFINPTEWDIFKRRVIEKIEEAIKKGSLKNEDLKRQKDQFLNVESQYRSCQQFLLQEMLNVAVVDPKDVSNLIENEVTTPEQLSQIDQELQNIFKGSGYQELKIRASNVLFTRLKTNLKKQEELRDAIITTKKDLVSSYSAVEFTNKFNSQIQQIIDNLKTGVDDPSEMFIEKVSQNIIDSQIEYLEDCLIENEDVEAAKLFCKVFHLRAELQAKEQSSRLSLKKLKEAFYCIGKLIDDVENDYKLLQSKGNEFVLERCENRKFSAKCLEMSYRFENLIRREENVLSSHQEQIEKEKKEYGQLWDKADILNGESDRLLISEEFLNTIGLCFAQEAHASEGPIRIVVDILQAGRKVEITFDHCSQALNEVGSFYQAHQEKAETAYGKIIEASKYAHRMTQICEQILRRTKKIKIPVPQFEKLEGLTLFFNQVRTLRGTQKSQEILEKEVAEASRNAKLIGEGEFFNEKVLKDVNEKIRDFSATMKYWLDNICPIEFRLDRFYFEKKED